MYQRRIILGSVVACLLAALLVGQSLSQPAQQGQRGTGRSPQAQRPGGQRMGGGQTQGTMMQRVRERLEISEEKWQAIQPKITRVMDLSRQTGGASGMGRMGMPFGGRGARGGQTPGQADRGDRTQAQARPRTREQTEVGKITDELRKLLENKAAKPEEIKAKLAVLRKAQEKAKQELAKAQQELRAELTVRQEAQLVLMGLLN